jgi:hypothetical protein
MTSLYINSRCFISACPPPVMILFIKWPATPLSTTCDCLHSLGNVSKQIKTQRNKWSEIQRNERQLTKRNTAKRKEINETKCNECVSFCFVLIVFRFAILRFVLLCCLLISLLTLVRRRCSDTLHFSLNNMIIGVT